MNIQKLFVVSMVGVSFCGQILAMQPGEYLQRLPEKLREMSVKADMLGDHYDEKCNDGEIKFASVSKDLSNARNHLLNDDALQALILLEKVDSDLNNDLFYRCTSNCAMNQKDFFQKFVGLSLDSFVAKASIKRLRGNQN